MAIVEEDEPSLRDLFARLVAHGRAYAQAELTVGKTVVSQKVAQWRPAVIMVVIAVFLVQAALTTLVIALGMALATWIGAAGGIALAGVIALLVAGLLGYLAVRRLQA